MRKPVFADPNAPSLEVKVFATGKREALYKALGSDPASIAKAVSDHAALKPHERKRVRQKVSDALKVVTDNVVPNMTDMQLDIGGRRIRIKALH